MPVRNRTVLAVVLADKAALRRLCGVTVLERLLRTLVRLGLDSVVVFGTDETGVREEATRDSPARRGLEVRYRPHPGRRVRREELLDLMKDRSRGSVAPGETPDRVALLDASMVYDPRLLRVLLESEPPAWLIDTAPPEDLRRLLGSPSPSGGGFWFGRAVLLNPVTPGWEDIPLPLSPALEQALGPVRRVDAARVPDYVVPQRRRIRPYFFPAPEGSFRKEAERYLLRAAQNGALDWPAYLHAPLENGLVRWLWRGRWTPNQVTLATTLTAFLAAGFFLTGHFAVAVLIALAVGVLDGVDGKLARTRVETSRAGEWEHVLDYLYENAWWAAAARYLAQAEGTGISWAYFFALVGADLVDRLAKRSVRNRRGRLLDDLTPLDRFVRLIGGRRNVYVWILALGVAAGRLGTSYRGMCVWGVLTALIHGVRAAVERFRKIDRRVQ